MRFTINCHHVKLLSGTASSPPYESGGGNHSPLQTYKTDDVEKVLECLLRLFINNQSGINKIVIVDNAMGPIPSLERAGQSPQEL